MKKTLLLFLLITSIITGYSQTLQTVTDYGNTTTNKLGIKISSPVYYFDHKITNNLPGIEKVFRISTYGGTNFSRRFNMEVLGNGANVNDFYQIYGGELHSSSTFGNPVFATYGNWSGFAWEWRGSSSDNLTLYGIESSTTGSPVSIQNTIINFNAVTGNVGIGTTTPKSKLAVNGQIRATEVKVLADVNSVPDYVFESDYDLRTLKETKEYIAQNKHLPEIPSATEIGENGIDLGDMNMRLLKKIEELTLYQIELMEEMEAMKKELQELKN